MGLHAREVAREKRGGSCRRIWSDNMSNQAPVLVLSCLALALSPGCARSKVEQDAGREPAARLVKTEAVRQESLRRTVEVVGTLAAEDEVTISSQADGVVRRVLADLGDPVKSGQTAGRDRSREAAIQPRRTEGGARAGAHEVRRVGAGPTAADRGDPRRAQGGRRTGAGQAGPANARTSCTSGTLIPQQALDDAETTLRSKQASYDSALQNARNLSADIDASDADHEAGRSISCATRTSGRRSTATSRSGWCRSGEFVKSQTPVMTVVRVDPLKAAGGDSRAHGAVDQGRTIDRPAGGRVSGQDVRRRRCRGSARPSTPRRGRSRSRRSAPNRRGAAEARHVRARASRNRARRAGPDDPVRGHAVPLRRLPRVRRQRAIASRPTN